MKSSQLDDTSDGSGSDRRGWRSKDASWVLIRAAFDQASDLPAAEQSAKVRSVCGEDEAAISETLRLLAADREGSGKGASTSIGLAAAAFGHWASSDPSTQAWQLAAGDGINLLSDILGARHPDRDDEFLDPPATIGSYTEVRPLARGGNGMVFSAVQANPHREVAIKVLRSRHVATGARKRFEREGHLLANLGHPSIAAVHEVGIESPDAPGSRGRPYIVMELVRGMTITEFATAHHLSREDRIGLIIQVCRAVGHANTSGVIHRDIKPSNLMVVHRTRALSGGASSGAAAAWLDCSHRFLIKVLDFGIAKLTQDLWGAHRHTTEEGQLLGTIDYMSPEQADGRTASARPTSDVFSIGMVLYELLASRPARSLPRESVMAALMHIGSEQIPDLGGVVPECRGELAAVIHKAIQTDPADRYRTADDFALDLVRYLRGEPVSARPRTAIVALRSWARMYPRAAALTGVAVAMLSGLGALLVWQTAAAGANAAEARANAVTASANADSATQALISLVTLASDQSWITDTRMGRARQLADAKALLVGWTDQHPNDPDAHKAMAKLHMALFDYSVEVGPEEPDHVRLAIEHTERSMQLRGPMPLEMELKFERFYTSLIVRLGDIEAHRHRFDLALAPWTRAWERCVAALAAHPEHDGLLDDLCWAEHRLCDANLQLSNWERAEFHRAGLEQSVARLVEQSPARLETLWAWLNAEGLEAKMAFGFGDLEKTMVHRVKSVHLGMELCKIMPQNREYAYTLVRNCYGAAGMVARVAARRQMKGESISNLPMPESFMVVARQQMDELARTESAHGDFWGLLDLHEGTAAVIALTQDDAQAYADRRRAGLQLAEHRLALFPLCIQAAERLLELRESVAGVCLPGIGEVRSAY